MSLPRLSYVPLHVLAVIQRHVSCAPILAPISYLNKSCTVTFVRRVTLLFPQCLLPAILLSSLNSSLPPMSHTHPTSTSSNFQLIFDNALKLYKKRTNNDLLKHPLANRLQSCNSPATILAVLQEQVEQLNQSQRSNTKWLNPTINVLLTFSEALGEGVSTVCFKTRARPRCAL